MPLYEYECGACGHRFEKIQKFSDPLVHECPSCGTGPVHKLLSAPAIQFKGSGWYITDYAGKKSDGTPSSDRRDDGTSENKSENKSEGKSDSKSDSSSETKSETKSESRSESKSDTKSDSSASSSSDSKPSTPSTGGGST
ncbi:MAG: zinc ribbon domain-containing protein [Vicinamibacterales bacterium]|nr:zinc ribbon domain-containing protein [Vicinamibacterales bacterium]